MDSNSELKLGHKSQQKMSPPQKRTRIMEFTEQVDIISHLPDHIIARVLSFLKTQEAIRTCVLSSRWRNLWKGITRIRLRGYGTEPEKFSNLVEHVLRNCSSTDFVAFELYCPLSIDFSRLNAWIGRIVGRKIERLILDANNTNGFDYNHFDLPDLPLPRFILSYTTLVFLKLDCFDIQIPNSVVCFPFLETLDLHVLLPDNVVAVNRLISSCPVLKKLYLVGVIDFETDSLDELEIIVSVTTLRRFKLQLKDMQNDYARKHEVIIDTPNLDYLYIEDDSLTKYVVKNLPWVSNVYVEYDAPLCYVPLEYKNHILELFKGIIIGVLTLHWNTINVLQSALSYTWPTFPYMMALVVETSLLSGWTCIPKLLHSAPTLSVLILDLEGINEGRSRPSDGWTQPDIVPKCLLRQLEIIGIQHFKGNQDEVQVAEYLLSNARVLERMMIGYKIDYRKEDVLDKLLMSPKACKSCKVEIYQYVYYESDIYSVPPEISVWGI